MLRDLGVLPNRIPFALEDRAVLFRSLIAGRRLLIMLDNASNASQVRPLIPGAAGPLLVVTSRNRMPSLAVRDGVGYVQVDVLPESDAVALVNEVTKRDRSDDSEADVTELVRLCARLPLALRIAAERAASRPGMRLVELIDDLRDTSGLWEALSVEDGSEADDVRTVFAWSYRSLPAQAAWMFRVIGTHPGTDISLPAAAAAAGTSVRDARRSTDVLVGAFLLEHATGSRFQMHDLLRAYANDESRTYDSESERRSILERMFCWYARSADNASDLLAPDDRLVSDLPVAPDVTPASFASADEALTWFEAERQNLLAVARLAEGSDMPTHSLALALAPSPIYMNYFYFDDWSEMTLIGLRSAIAATHVRDKAVVQENRGKYLLRRGEYGEARVAFTEARQIYEQANDRRGGAESTNSLGLVCLRLRDLNNAAGLFASATAAFSDLEDLRWQGVCRSNLAEAKIESGDVSATLDDLEGLLVLFERLGDVAMQGNTLWLLALAYRLDGNVLRAKAAIDRALAIAEEARNKMWEGFWLIEAARIQLDLGNTADAMLSCQLAASLQRQIGDKSREAMALHCTGDVLRHMQRAAEASAFHLLAASQFHELGEAWNEACARLGAADCAAILERFDSEREQLRLVYACLEPYSDWTAIALKRDVIARLG
jgi:tetratricopeptide (TPR) repeat protein